MVNTRERGETMSKRCKTASDHMFNWIYGGRKCSICGTFEAAVECEACGGTGERTETVEYESRGQVRTKDVVAGVCWECLGFAQSLAQKSG